MLRFAFGVQRGKAPPMRSSRLLFPFLLVALTGCADKAPPVWPADAELAVESTTDSISLSWPAAEDDRGVARFVIKQGAEVVAELDGAARDYLADGLDDGTEVRFEVYAEDEANNRSEMLSVVARTADGTAPHWPAGAALRGEGGQLRWPAAVDSLGVEEYVVSKGEQELATVSELSFAFDGEPAGVHVVARDEAGNESAPLTWREGDMVEEIAAAEGAEAEAEAHQLNPEAAQALPRVLPELALDPAVLDVRSLQGAALRESLAPNALKHRRLQDLANE